MNNQLNNTNNALNRNNSSLLNAENLNNHLAELVGNVDLANLIQTDLNQLIIQSNTNNIPILRNISSNQQNSAMNEQYHTHGTSFHSHQHDAAQLQSNSNESSDLNDRVVLNLTQNPNTSQVVDPQQLQAVQEANNEQNPHNNLMITILNMLQSSLPFFLILVAKIFHQHLLGFFVVLGFMTTLHWSNRMLVHQIELKDKKENHKLILLILFLMTNVVVFFLIFKDYELENCLLFMKTNIAKMDIWNLIWIIACSDTIIKFFTISVKAFITLLPFSIIRLRKRGSFYSAIESYGLLYRSLTPISSWITFLLYSETSASFLLKDKQLETEDFVPPPSSSVSTFAIFLCILYAIFKLNQLYGRYIEFKQSFNELLLSNSYGTPVVVNGNEEASNQCPICQEKFKNPVLLKCKHTFCEDCICIWLDKVNSCPMCRSKVSIRQPKFKDGSTTVLVQWF